MLVFTTIQWPCVRPAATDALNALLSLSASPVLPTHEGRSLVVAVLVMWGTMITGIEYARSAVHTV
jgi:hypothetical protein